MKNTIIPIGIVILVTILGTLFYQSRQTSEPSTTTADVSTGGLLEESPPPLPTGSALHGQFVGRTLCMETFYDFYGIPKDPACERIKWSLYLYQNPNTSTPTTYRLNGTLGTQEGTWKIAKGIETDSDAIVYQLNGKNPQLSLSFLKLDNNHLFFLDENMNLLVGNKLFSYTLSRTK